MDDSIKNPIQPEKEKSERKTTIRESAVNIARTTGKDTSLRVMGPILRTVANATGVSDLTRSLGLTNYKKKYNTIQDIIKKNLTPEEIINIPFEDISKQMYVNVNNSTLNERQKLALKCRLWQRIQFKRDQPWDENECSDALLKNTLKSESVTLETDYKGRPVQPYDKYKYGGKKYTRRKTRTKMRKSKRKRYKKRSTRRR